MINLYELEDITLLPSPTNIGHPGNKINFQVKDESDITGIPESLPIFTSPMASIVGRSSAQVYSSQGIKPIIPSTEPLQLRLDMCGLVFCAFTLSEVKRVFLDVHRQSNTQFHICIDAGNGHDTNLLEICFKLKESYREQVEVMGGNVGLPEAYGLYSKAGFDYMRCGLASGSLVDKAKYGFHYPMASLLEDIKTYKTSGPGKGLRPVKIICDGGITCPSDIIKAIALGADYVMIGREFSKLIEAEGAIYQKDKDQNGEVVFNQVDKSLLGQISGYQARVNGYCRPYYGNSTPEMRAKRAGYSNVDAWKKSHPRVKVKDAAWDWVSIDSTLSEWVAEFKHCVYYSFMMTGSLTWQDFKTNAKYGIQQ